MKFAISFDRIFVRESKILKTDKNEFAVLCK